MSWAPRRIITGHDAEGRSVVLSDGVPPMHLGVASAGVAFWEVWNTDAMRRR